MTAAGEQEVQKFKSKFELIILEGVVDGVEEGVLEGTRAGQAVEKSLQQSPIPKQDVSQKQAKSGVEPQNPMQEAATRFD